MKYKSKSKEFVDTNTRENYSYGLAKAVGQACDAWLEKRDMKALPWKKKQKETKETNCTE